MLYRKLIVVTTALVSVGCAVAGVSAQASTPPPVHAAREVILSGQQSEVEIPLSFSGFDPSAVINVLVYNATGQALKAGEGARLKEITLATSGPYAGQRVARLYTDAGISPQKLILELRNPSNAVAFIHVPFVAPRPQVTKVEFIRGGTVVPSFSVIPNQRVTTQVRVTGGPFLPGTKLEMPKPFEVGDDPVVTKDQVTATVVQPARPSYEIPVGSVLLSITNTRGGESQQVPLDLRGEQAPQVLDLTSGIAVSAESRETFTLTVNNIADSAQVEIQESEGIKFASINLPLGDLTGETVTLSADLPPLNNRNVPGNVRIRVVNHDGSVGERMVRVYSAPRPTLKVTGPEKLTLGVPTAVVFEPQNSPAALFSGSPGEYTLSIHGNAIELADAEFDTQRSSMRATVNVPVTLGSETADEVSRTVRLHGPGLPSGALEGLITLSGVPMIEAPTTVVPLRPGETRAVSIRGRRLSKVEMRGTETIRVNAQAFGQETGTVTLQAIPTAQVGTTGRVEGFRGSSSAGLTVQVVSWLPHPDLARIAMYQVDNKTHRFNPSDTLEVSPGKELRFRIDATDLVPPEGELVRASIVKEGTVVWQDSVFVHGTAVDFPRAFQPGTVFDHGQEFSLTLTGQGGAFVQQRFRLRYERGLVCGRCIRGHSGVSAVQVPLFSAARREFSDGLFTGVMLGASHSWDGLANRLNGDYVRFIVLISASKPPLTEAEEAAEAEASASVRRSVSVSQEEGQQQRQERLAYGISTGFLFFDSIFLTAGSDSRGDNLREGLHVSFGGSFDLTALPGLLRRE